MPYTEVPQMSRLRPAFEDPHAFASTLVTAMTELYGTEAFKWHPATILMHIEEDTGAKLPPTNFDRLMAAIVLHRTDRFYKVLRDFNELCTILSGAPATPGVWVPADADDCAWGITEALLMVPPDPTDPAPFTDEIRAYIAGVLQREGIITPPDILRIASINPGALKQVQADFADDPTMSEAIWQSEDAKTQDINKLVRERLMRLIDQLSNLQLVDGKVEELAAKLLAALAAHKPQPSL